MCQYEGDTEVAGVCQYEGDTEVAGVFQYIGGVAESPWQTNEWRLKGRYQGHVTGRQRCGVRQCHACRTHVGLASLCFSVGLQGCSVSDGAAREMPR